MGQAVRINLGCGRLKLEGFVNVDQFDDVEPDVVSDATSFLGSQEDNSVDEIYAGHFLEHLDYEQGQALLSECFRALRSGGRLGIVVPDTEIVMKLYCMGRYSLHNICEEFLYSTVQPSRHQWSYDKLTLKKAIENVGFVTTKEIDREKDSRVIGAWYQVGWDAEKP